MVCLESLEPESDRCLPESLREADAALLAELPLRRFTCAEFVRIHTASYRVRVRQVPVLLSRF